jgi:hypothetical protein
LTGFSFQVAGGQGTGKTSLLRLLLETADISPTATLDQRAAVDRFLRGYPKATQSISTACVEICESRYDRILFSVIDSPGLDFIEGRELKLERQVSSIVKYIDAQYSDTLSEVCISTPFSTLSYLHQRSRKSFVKAKATNTYTCECLPTPFLSHRATRCIRCIYLIDPTSVISVAARRAQSSLPAKTRSETTVSQRTPPDLVPDTSSGDDSDDEEERITMSPAEIRVIKRLAGRVNVLPIVAHADSLTDEKLKAVKEAVRQDLHDAGVDFGVFGSALPSRGRQDSEAETPKRKTRFQSKPRQTNGDGTTNGTHEPSDPSSPASPGSGGDGAESDDEERASRPVIKLRPRHPSQRTLSRSRSRRDLHQAAHDESRPVSPDNESIANVRFSAHIVAKVDLSNIMPFAIIAPEMKRARRHLASDGAMPRTAPSSPVQQSEDGHASIMNGDTLDPPFTAASTMGRNLPYLDGPVEDLKGVFTRKFRWGTVDVLNPDHCDFAALRTAVMSTHLKVAITAVLSLRSFA